MNSPIRVLMVTPAPVDEAALAPVRAAAPGAQLEMRVAKSVTELDETWPGFQVLYTAHDLPRPEQMPDLDWVQAHFAGMDHLLAAGSPLLRQVKLTTASGIHATPMSEYALMMMLAFAHRLPQMAADQTRAHWSETRWSDYVPTELRGQNLGILGYGSVGREMARLATALGMRVLALKREESPKADSGWQIAGLGDPEGVLPARYFTPDELPLLLADSDYVLLTLPLTEATRHIINRQSLAHMKRSAVLMNVGRGGLVDEPALIEALQTGRLRGAGLDVFETEPLPADSPLWSLPNVLVSPHISGFSPVYDVRAMELFAENLRRYMAGGHMFNLVDLSGGY
ncbi:MAG: D-2-hydroxyacid dehydrogenase [Anaerolineales bacterium]